MKVRYNTLQERGSRKSVQMGALSCFDRAAREVAGTKPENKRTESWPQTLSLSVLIKVRGKLALVSLRLPSCVS